MKFDIIFIEMKNTYLIFLVLIILGALLISGGLILKNNLSSNQDMGKTYSIIDDANTNISNKTLQLKTIKFVEVKPLPAANCNSTPIKGTSENDILWATIPGPGETVGAGGSIKAFYADEWPITLGSGSVSPLNGNPGHIVNPNIGDINARDTNNFPYFPAIFITDITNDPNSTSGDAQNGGKGYPPSEIYGVWKVLNGRVGSDCRSNPNQNFCNKLNLGSPDAFPSQSNLLKTSTPREPQASAEIIWNVDSLGLTQGHNYRVQIVLHDGDQNNGDIGQACTTIRY